MSTLTITQPMLFVNLKIKIKTCNNFHVCKFGYKDYKIGICCFSAEHAALRRKSKDWLDRNQDNVPEWSDMST
jgi:hypothetical protein